MTAVAEQTMHDCRDAYVEALLEAAEGDERIVVVVNDSVGSSKLAPFAQRFPERLINVGIAEQDMVGIAAGLANGGKIPFVSGAAPFLTARAMEQVKVDAAYAQGNVKLCGMSPGMAYGQLGPTHHSIEDLAWLRAIPDLAVIVPSDPAETAQAIAWAAEHTGPVFVRVSRMGVPAVNEPDYRFTPGKAVVLREGSDVTLMANGTVVTRALEAADVLAGEGVAARVLSVPSIRPFDVEAVVAAARETGAIVTAEEATVNGGLGGAVAEVVVENHPVPVQRVGVPDTFAPTGSAGWLMDHFGISAEGIADAARATMARKR